MADLKQLHRRMFEEAWGKGNVAVFYELCGPGYRGHDPLTGDLDVDQAREECRMYRAAFPDLKPTILASYTDGETVITHWRMTGTHRGPLLGMEPTGKRCTAEAISIAEFRGGKIVEDWVHWDALGLFRQLGVTLQPSSARGAEVRPHA